MSITTKYTDDAKETQAQQQQWQHEHAKKIIDNAAACIVLVQLAIGIVYMWITRHAACEYVVDMCDAPSFRNVHRTGIVLVSAAVFTILLWVFRRDQIAAAVPTVLIHFHRHCTVSRMVFYSTLFTLFWFGEKPDCIQHVGNLPVHEAQLCIADFSILMVLCLLIVACSIVELVVPLYATTLQQQRQQQCCYRDDAADKQQEKLKTNDTNVCACIQSNN